MNTESTTIHYLFYQIFKLNADLVAASANSQLNEYVSNIIFVTNLPPYLEDQHVKSIFNCYGKVDHVMFNTKPNAKSFESYLEEQENLKNKMKLYFKSNKNDSDKKYGYKDCYVFFNQPEAVERAIAKQKNDRIVIIGSLNHIGIKSNLLFAQINQYLNAFFIDNIFIEWVDEYKSSFVDARVLQKEIDFFMEEYDKNKELVSNLNKIFLFNY